MTPYEISESFGRMELLSKSQIRERAKAAGLSISALCRLAGIPYATFNSLAEHVGTRTYVQLIDALERAEAEKVAPRDVAT